MLTVSYCTLCLFLECVVVHLFVSYMLCIGVSNGEPFCLPVCMLHMWVWWLFSIFDRCLFSAMCPVRNCTRSDVCLCVSLLVSFAKAAEGIDRSILSAFPALGDLAKNSLASLLLSFLNLCSSAALLQGSIPQHSMGIRCSSLVTPPAAAFASSSTLLFPATPSCPGTHHKIMFLPGVNLVMLSTCLCSALTRY